LIVLETFVQSQETMQYFLALANIIVLCMSTMVQLTLVREYADRFLFSVIILTAYRMRMMRMTSGSAASSYIMRRFREQDVKTEPFLGFCSGFFGKHDDLLGVGTGVRSDNGKRIQLKALAVLIGNQGRQEHRISLFQALVVFEGPCNDFRQPYLTEMT
jgi:hypothetical protein